MWILITDDKNNIIRFDTLAHENNMFPTVGDNMSEQIEISSNNNIFFSESELGNIKSINESCTKSKNLQKTPFLKPFLLPQRFRLLILKLIHFQK